MLQLRAHTTHLRDIVAARQLQAFVRVALATAAPPSIITQPLQTTTHRPADVRETARPTAGDDPSADEQQGGDGALHLTLTS
jgi:hypothetical protein